MNKIEKKVSMLIMLCVCFLSTLLESSNLSARVIDSPIRSEEGDIYYFFFPENICETNYDTYVFDTKFNRLLRIPRDNATISRFGNEQGGAANWATLLNDLLHLKDIDKSGIWSQNNSQLKVIEIGDDWIRFSHSGRHIVLPKELMVENIGIHQSQQENIPIGKGIVNKETSLPQDYRPDDLVKIDQQWNYHTQDYSKYLRIQVVFMLHQMLNNAKEQGVHIRVFSAYRSYKQQRYLYLKEISLSGLDRINVAKPGHSEHQLGTSVDLCGLDPSTVLNRNFGLTREGRWLKEHSQKFDFYQSYTMANKHITGYIPEPWHYRYKPMLQH